MREDGPVSSNQQPAPDLISVPAVARRRWADLVRVIERARDAYYNAVDAQSPMSDAEYDRLYRELEELEAAHPALSLPSSPTRSVGGRPVTDFAPAPHHERMYSLRDVFSLEEVEEWAGRMAVETDVPDDELPMTAEVKIDGLAIALTYEHDRRHKDEGEKSSEAEAARKHLKTCLWTTDSPFAIWL